jgi:hypothetical protein
VQRLLDTVYSLSGEVPPIDPAVEEADAAALQRGALAVGSIRRMCLIRKIAAAGAVLHVDMPAEEGQRLELELETGEQLAGNIVWQRGCEIGLKFDEPIDILPILARNLVSQAGERRRMPRVEVSCPALLEAGARHELVMLRDLAQGGAKIETPFPLAPAEVITLTPEGLRPLEAVVRWANDRVAGIAFEPELSWQELMPWLKARRQQPPPDFLAGSTPAAADVPPPAPRSGEAGSIQLNLPARVREGTRRWQIDVATLTSQSVEFDCFAGLRMGTLLWIVLPGLEGWPARIVSIDGYRFTCEFTQPLHPAVLERVLAIARPGAA